MGALADIVKQRSPYLRLEAGESTVATYKGYKLVPSTYDPENEVFRFMLDIGGETKYWDTGSNKVAMVFDECKVGDVVKITKGVVIKNGKESTSWEVTKDDEKHSDKQLLEE